MQVGNYFNTLYLQRVLGYSPLEAGLPFLPFTAGIIIGAGLSQGGLVPKVGARELPLIEMTMAIVGMLLFIRLQPGGAHLTDFLPGVMLASIGMGLTFVPITLIATSGIPDADAGLASGLYNTSQQIGGALGLAILSTFAVSATDDTLADVGGQPTRADQAQALVDGSTSRISAARCSSPSRPCSSGCSCDVRMSSPSAKANRPQQLRDHRPPYRQTSPDRSTGVGSGRDLRRRG